MIQKKIISKFIILIIALQILNMSIDIEGMETLKSKSGADNFNYIDSYAEYIVEVILKYENAISETKEKAHRELQQHKRLQIICEIKEVFASQNVAVKSCFEISNPPDNYTYQFIKEINHPPCPDFS